MKKHFTMKVLSNPLLIIKNLLWCGMIVAASFLDAQIQWQKSLGGAQEEYLYDMLPTPDYGFLLAGSSVSSVSGNKQTDSFGKLDYWLWKMKEDGAPEWQQNLGGIGNDFLRSIAHTADGGYILGGSSDSPLSEVKSDSCRGKQDYWVVKLDAAGKVVWERTLGGTGNDELQTIRPLTEGGYIVCGTSDSLASYEKSSESRGSTDYWIIKIDNYGKILWQRTLGGHYREEAKGVEVLPNHQGYVVYGTSNSPEGGDKTTKALGKQDLWLIYLDEAGEIRWQKTLGGKGNDLPAAMKITPQGTIAVLAYSNSFTKEGTDYWLIQLDEHGRVLQDKTYNIGEYDIATGLTLSKDGSFLISGYNRMAYEVKTPPKETEDYVVFKVDEDGKQLWKKTFGGKGSDRLLRTVETRDGGYLLSGTSNSKTAKNKRARTHGFKDYWLVKLGDINQEYAPEPPRAIEIYPVPTERYATVVIPYDFIHGEAQVYDYAGHLLARKELKRRTEALDLVSLPSGLYLVKVITNKEEVSKKIIKK